MLQETYIGVKLQDVQGGKGLLSSTTAGSSWATEADQPSEKEKAEKAEKQDKKSNPNFIVKESQKQYTRSKYVNSLRVGVRLVLPCGRYNFFYEVKSKLIEKFSILFFRFLENAFFFRVAIIQRC